MKKHNVQQRSPEWQQLRKGKITGTGLQSLMGTPAAREGFFYEIVAQRLSVGGIDVEEHPMERGTRLEPDAIAAFEFETGKTVETVGLLEDDNNPSIANSPDGIIGETEAIEVKCMGGKNHVKMWFTNELPKEYLWQVIQYFVVNKKLQTLHFVAYNPDIPVHPLHILEVTRSGAAKSIKAAEEAQKEFIEKVNNKLKEIVKI